MTAKQRIVSAAWLGSLLVCVELPAQVLCRTAGIHSTGKDREFAKAVALSGDWFVAGAEGDRTNGEYAGAAHVFRREAGDWTEVAKLLASDGEASAGFGHSVAISGKRIVAGAPWQNAHGNDSGAAYVFEWDDQGGSGWRQTARLTPDDARRLEEFGYSVACEADRIVVGAPSSTLDAGAAYVFNWDGAAWIQGAKLLPDAERIGDFFGHSIATRGDRIVAGALLDDEAGTDAGAVYVFHWDGAKWQREAKLLPDAPGTVDFSRFLAFDGARLIVSARLQFSGWVYVYRLNGDQWALEAKLTLDDTGEWDQFGEALVFFGGKILAGDYTKNEAYLYDQRDGAWILRDVLYHRELPEDHDFARSAASDGETLIVGAPGDDDDGIKGWAYAFEYACGAPDNDDCDTRIALPFPSVVEGTTKGGTIETLEECSRGAAVIAPSVWYSVVGTGGWMQADTCAEARFNTKLSVYEGTCEGLICVTGNNNACGDLSVVQWASNPGVEYFIVVHGTLEASGDFTLTLSEPPGNFDCNAITKLSGKCRGGAGETRTIKAKLVSELPPRTQLSFTLDGARVEPVRVNERGKATAEFVDVGPYEHQVSLLECPWVSKTSDCGSEGPPDLVWITQGHMRANDIAFSPDGQLIATAGGYRDVTIKLWRAVDGALLQTLTGHNGEVNTVAFSPDGQYLASGGDDHAVKLWRVADGSIVWTVYLNGTGNAISSVAFSPDQQLLAAGGRDDYLSILRVADGSIVLNREMHWPVYGTAFSPDGTLLAFLSFGLNVYRTSDWTPVFRDYNAVSPSVVFSPDGSLLAAGGSAGTIKLWSVADGSVVRVMTGHTERVESLDFSADGKVLGSGSADRTIRLWNVDDGALRRMYDEQIDSTVYGFRFSPDGAHFGYATNLGVVALARSPF